MNKLPNGSIAVGAPGSNARALAEIADSLLSTNDADVITKKRENFKKVLEEAVNHWAYKDPKYLNIDSLVELIVQKTFDESVVN